MSALTVLSAALLDAAFREPPAALHPVRAMGSYLGQAAKYVPERPPGRATVAGTLAWSTGAAACAALGATLSALPGRVLPGMTLWSLFSRRMLLDEVSAVEDALTDSVASGRAAVARLVSRDTSTLSETQVRQAAIESLAENLSDSVVAPLLWYALGGLPAAAAYRFANTADAMWGYRTPRWQHAGKTAARADDLLNLLPARLTGLAIAGSPMSLRGTSTMSRHDQPVPLRALRREARRTPSPNAGWPMAALALRLGVRLEKPGVYSLNPAGRPPTRDDTRAAVRLTSRVGWAAVAVAAAVSEIRSPLKGRQ